MPDLSEENITSNFSFEPASVGFYLGLLFDPEDRSDTFLRNVWLSPSYIPFEVGRAHYSRTVSVSWITPRPFYPLGNSSIVIGGWMDPRANLKAVAERKLSIPSRNRTSILLSNSR
jgi:hypothetical protein